VVQLVRLEKRQRTGAVQKLANFLSVLVSMKRLGMWQTSAAFAQRTIVIENNSPGSTPEQDVLNAVFVPLEI